ncbi:1,4-alpha-glucan branching protein GlgB [Lachnospiraceae bacterium 46-15]
MAPAAKRQEEELRVGDLDQYLFGQGTHYDIYKKLGAHKTKRNGRTGIYFAVWAPNAAAVNVIGEFNGWNEENIPMERLEPLGIYEAFVPEAKVGMLYKFLIHAKDGRKLYKADPFANSSELRPGNASRIADIPNFRWGDSVWMEKRELQDVNEMPMSIYEVHPGSWKKHPWNEQNEDGFYNYRELAHSLTEYVKEMGYTHVELMGIAEHPFDGSWGYQVTGYYAPSSRYGTPEDFMYLVNYLHKNKIGVILDWVPAHFPRDAHGLAEFDGTCVFEYADPRKGEHPDWGTKVFDFGKNEVKNFLIANALFWLEQFHVDGLRVDAVASILYLDYGRRDGQWVPNKYGGNKNLEAIEFFKHLNSVVLGRNHGALMIAEESTAWPMVTGRPEDDGLGFSMKWNMGWMNDFLEYMKLDPYFRKYNHNKMTFAMSYTYSEKYILVLSHDEVVHLKCSMINKMPGLYDDKFANLKAGYSFMIGHPGKKLLFMGQDFAQFQEWSEARELDWYLLGEEKHRQLQSYVRELLHLYKSNPACYEADNHPTGFEWINADDGDRSIFSFVRHSFDGKNNLLFVVNFTPVARPDYRVGVPKKKQYRLILNSDAEEFGGSGKEQPVLYRAAAQECDGREYSFAYDLPAYGVAVFKF